MVSIQICWLELSIAVWLRTYVSSFPGIVADPARAYSARYKRSLFDDMVDVVAVQNQRNGDSVMWPVTSDGSVVR